MQKKVGAWSGGKSWSAERRCQKGYERGAAMSKRAGARSDFYPRTGPDNDAFTLGAFGTRFGGRCSEFQTDQQVLLSVSKNLIPNFQAYYLRLTESYGKTFLLYSKLHFTTVSYIISS